MKNTLVGLYRALKDILFPPACLICHARLNRQAGFLLCPGCADRIKLLEPPLCTCCGREFPDSAPGNHFCGTCQQQPPFFSKARAVIRYNEFSAPLIHASKYRGQTAGRQTFVTLMRQAPAVRDLMRPDLIIPVPLHIKRLRERGFNQALLLARSFYPDMKKRIMPQLLIRNRWTTPQTNLNGSARRKNLAGAFLAPNPAMIRAKKIILIDDVFTTGTTLNECARVLRRHGAREVEALTLARVLD